MKPTLLLSGRTPMENNTHDARLQEYINRTICSSFAPSSSKKDFVFFCEASPPPPVMPGNVTRAVQPETPGRLVSSPESSRVRQMSLGMLRGAFTSSALSV